MQPITTLPTAEDRDTVLAKQGQGAEALAQIAEEIKQDCQVRPEQYVDEVIAHGGGE